MRTRIAITGVALTLFAAPMVMARTATADAPPQAASPVEDATTASAFPLDVAGVRLGSSVQQARAALAKAGYSIPAMGGTTYDASFASQVRAEAERRRTGRFAPTSMADRVATKLEARGPGREAIVVRLAAAPSGGSVVVEVQLTIPGDAMKGDAFLRQAVAKYGRPDGGRDGGMTLAWCTAPLKARCGKPSPFERPPEALPYLEASTVFNSDSIRMSDGSEQERERQRALAAAVDRAAPKADRAAF